MANRGAIIIGKETTYGTQATSLNKCYPFFSENITSENVVENVNLIAKNFEYSKYYTGDFNVRGDVRFPVYYNLGGHLLYALFGSVTSELKGTTAYKHTFALSDTLPSYSFYIDRGIAATDAFINLGGIMNTMNVVISRRQTPIVFETSWIFKNEKNFSGVEPTYTVPTEKIFIRTNSMFKINNTQNDMCKEITININKNIDIEEAKVLTSGRFVAEPVNGVPEVTGSVTFRFLNLNEWKLFWGAFDATEPQDEISGVALETSITGDLIETTYYNALKFIIPNAVLTRRGGGTLTERGRGEVTYDWVAHYDTTLTHKISCELTNTQTSYTT